MTLSAAAFGLDYNVRIIPDSGPYFRPADDTHVAADFALLLPEHAGVTSLAERYPGGL